MSCAIHSEKKDVAKCVVCKKPLCKECEDFCEKYGACPSCLKRQVEGMFQTSKKGIWYALAGLVCATIFLVLYVVDIILGKMDKTFVIVGAVILSVLLPLTIFLLVFSLKRAKKMKNILKDELK